MEINSKPDIVMPLFLTEKFNQVELLLIAITLIALVVAAYALMHSRLKIAYRLYKTRIELKNKRMSAQQVAYYLSELVPGILLNANQYISHDEYQMVRFLKYKKGYQSTYLELSSLIKKLIRLTLVGRK